MNPSKERYIMDVMEAIRLRRSIRNYSPTPIPEALLQEVTETLRLAPSACNYQPWRFILVSDPALKTKIAQACNGQMFIVPAPLLVVGCALPRQAYPKMGGYWNSADIDVAIAMDQFMIVAAAAGLGTCWIGAFKEEPLKELLKIPAEAKIVALSPLGYPAHEGLFHDAAQEPRKSRLEVIGLNEF